MSIVVIVLLAIVALFVLGAVVIGLTLKLLGWALIGLVIGALARLALPGRQTVGLLATALFGVAGALLGGIIADAADVGTILQFVIAVAVAAALIAAFGATRERGYV
jgi:uncharacterized membrane protein YeaQ/YmgE (transglycosylase-associated protein family)